MASLAEQVQFPQALFMDFMPLNGWVVFHWNQFIASLNNQRSRNYTCSL